MTAEVGVVVVAYHSAGTIGAMLDSLKGASGRPLDVVVVDNSPAEIGRAHV